VGKGLGGADVEESSSRLADLAAGRDCSLGTVPRVFGVQEPPQRERRASRNAR
jgi:hypothetical protein